MEQQQQTTTTHHRQAPTTDRPRDQSREEAENDHINTLNPHTTPSNQSTSAKNDRFSSLLSSHNTRRPTSASSNTHNRLSSHRQQSYRDNLANRGKNQGMKSNNVPTVIQNASHISQGQEQAKTPEKPRKMFNFINPSSRAAPSTQITNVEKNEPSLEQKTTTSTIISVTQSEINTEIKSAAHHYAQYDKNYAQAFKKSSQKTVQVQSIVPKQHTQRGQQAMLSNSNGPQISNIVQKLNQMANKVVFRALLDNIPLNTSEGKIEELLSDFMPNIEKIEMDKKNGEFNGRCYIFLDTRDAYDSLLKCNEKFDINHNLIVIRSCGGNQENRSSQMNRNASNNAGSANNAYSRDNRNRDDYRNKPRQNMTYSNNGSNSNYSGSGYGNSFNNSNNNHRYSGGSGSNSNNYGHANRNPNPLSSLLRGEENRSSLQFRR